MDAKYRAVLIVGGVACLAATGLSALTLLPPAVASEAQSQVMSSTKDLFAGPKFDPNTLRKFDIVLDDSVSTEVTHEALVTKIGFGQRTIVSIVTTPSGTYSSDALTSPHVRYAGIEVTPLPETWPVFPRNAVSVSTSDTPWGKSTSLKVRSGSFVYYSQTFVPAPGHSRVW
jgi:hypothetical protein